VHRRNLEALAARLTGQFVVDADQVIAQLLELGAVLFVGVAGHPVFLGSPHPAHLVVVGALAPRARVAAVALLGPFVEERAFVECHRAILTGRTGWRGRV
jgi:hypothetical protein